jgi:hypothetical protein
LLAQIHNTNRPYHLPKIGHKLAYQANRNGVAERLPASAVHKSLEVDRTLSDADYRLRTALALDRVRTAKAHDAQTVSRLRSIPVVGKSLALVLLDEIHAMHRFPRGQECVADGRLVKCAKASAGNR